MAEDCHDVYWACRVRICKECFDKQNCMCMATFLDGTKTDLTCSRLDYDHYSSSDYHLYDDTTKDLLEDRWQITALVPDLTLLSINRMR